MSESQDSLFDPDIVQRIRRKFGVDADAVFAQLVAFCRESPELAESRIVRCIVHAAHTPAGIGHYIEMAHKDPRDVMLTAEYQTRPGTKRWQGIYDQIHDFRRPFSD